MTAESLQRNPPRWLARQRQALPPAPSPENPMETAYNEYDTLRGNYAAALSQIAELSDICREQSHRIEVLETLQTEERGFYRNEIEAVTRQRDILAAFSGRLETRLTAISELINGAMHEALTAADGANRAHAQHATEPQPDSEHDDTEIRRIVQGIANANQQDESQ
jgi:hypothetical protein